MLGLGSLCFGLGVNGMSSAIAVNWWALAIRGVGGILLGIAAIVWPGITLLVLIAIFAAYLLIDGAFAVLVVEGVAGVVAAILAVLWPGITALILVYLVAAWAIVTGALELGAAYLLRQVVKNEWLLVVGGLVSIVFGILLAINPAAGLVTIVWLFGAYMLIFGVVILALALRLRNTRATMAAGATT
jgi:uncharacterized membrane protein HdeD (DUF308 family)